MSFLRNTATGARQFRVVRDARCGQWLQACVCLPEGELAQGTAVRRASIARPPGAFQGAPHKGQEVAVSACLSHLSIGLAMLRARSPSQRSPERTGTTPPWVSRAPLQCVQHRSGWEGTTGLGRPQLEAPCILKLQGAPVFPLQTQELINFVSLPLSPGHPEPVMRLD